MDEQLVGTLAFENYKADIYSLNMPGEFKVVYSDPSGRELEQSPLTGISSYHQRELEIYQRLRELSENRPPESSSNLADSGEY